MSKFASKMKKAHFVFLCVMCGLNGAMAIIEFISSIWIGWKGIGWGMLNTILAALFFLMANDK